MGNQPQETALKKTKKVVESRFIDLPPDQQRLISNGLADAILGFNPGGIGTPVNQVETIFVNLRWYLISNMRQPLNQAYAETGIIKTVVDVPVDDAFRGGFDLHSKQLSAYECEKLQGVMEEEDDLGKFAEACRWDRLFGGAGVIINTGQDPQMQLTEKDIFTRTNKLLSFKPCDMWELYWDKQNIEGDGEPLDNPAFDFYQFYGKKLHKSRVMKLTGQRAPSFIRPRLRGWGLSIVEYMVNSVNQYLKGTNLVFEVLDEFKVDVFKIQNLNDAVMSADGANMVQKRVQLANLQKNFQHALTMDAEDDYAQKQVSFSGIAEAQEGIRLQMASDMRMPLTKLFGIGAKGFNAGEEDLENYNSMVESTVRTKVKRYLLRAAKLRALQLYGYMPEDLKGEFKSLRVLSSVDEENVKTQKYNRAHQAVTTGLITMKQFTDICNKGKLFDVQLDPGEDSFMMKDDESSEDEPVTEKREDMENKE